MEIEVTFGGSGLEISDNLSYNPRDAAAITYGAVDPNLRDISDATDCGCARFVSKESQWIEL